MSTDPPIKPQDIPPNELPETRSLSPGQFLALAVIAVALLAGGALAVFFATQGPPPPPGAAVTGVQTIALPDGGKLVLEAVTWGTSHDHEIRFTTGSAFTAREQTARLGTETHPAAHVVWLSCYDEAGRVRDLRWMSHAAAVDESGKECRDDDGKARQFMATEGKIDSEVGRPLPEVGLNRYRRVIATTIIPPLRHKGDSFPLRIYGTDGSLVGEFDVPDSSAAKGKYPVWKPEELPVARKLDDDLTVTLASFRGEILQSRATQNGQQTVVNRNRLRHRFVFHENGKRTQKWDVSRPLLKDAFGNSATGSDVSRLNSNEPAWKVVAKFYRRSVPEYFQKEEIWNTGEISIPGPKQKTWLKKKGKVQETEFEILAVGGPGSATYEVLAPGAGEGGVDGPIRKIIGDNRPAPNFSVRTQHTTGDSLRIQVDCPLPHILLRWTAKPPLPRIFPLKAEDGNGKKLLLHGPYPNQGGAPSVYFFRRPHDDDTGEAIKKVSVSFAVNSPKQAEFFVKPPKFKPAPFLSPLTRSASRRLAESQESIARYLARLNQNPKDATRNNEFAWAVVMAPEEFRTADLTARALAAAEFAHSERPKVFAYRNTLAMALLRAGKTPEAIRKFQKNLDEPEARTMVYDLYGLALAFTEAREMKKAEQSYRNGLKSHRMKDFFRHSRTHVIELRDEVEAALLGGSPVSILSEVDKLVGQGDLEAASESLESLLKVHDYSARPWYNAAVLAAARDNEKRWQTCCRELAERFADSDEPEILILAGLPQLIQIQKSDLAVARRAIERARVLSRDQKAVGLATALLRFRQSRYPKAVLAAREALEGGTVGSGRESCLLATLAMAAFRAGDPATAEKSLEEAQQIQAGIIQTKDGRSTKSWPDRLLAEIFVTEASRVIGRKD